MRQSVRGRVLSLMVLWCAILGAFGLWLELDNRQGERELAMRTAKAFFQQVLISRQWNARHGGVYVPVSQETPPNPYLPEAMREVRTDSGLRLARMNPSYMTRQMADLAARQEGGGIRFHITSRTPLRPENRPEDWEKAWLVSFEQGEREQGEFFHDSQGSWFRYMAPLLVGPECLSCHGQQGYRQGEVRGGISVSLPYPDHTHRSFLVGLGSAWAIGLLLIFLFGTFYERKRRLFDATFNSPVPTCVTDTNYTILMANDAYWAEFGPLPDGATEIKCHAHRPGRSCHTENCPLVKILAGASRYVCEPSKEKDGQVQHFLVTAQPLRDSGGKVIGVVESFMDITERRQLEAEKEGLIAELTASLEQVKQLSGLIPICASCKQVRDDQGFWTQVESYISRHSEAKFSHGLCPDCVRKLYPELSDQILGTVGQNNGLAKSG